MQINKTYNYIFWHLLAWGKNCTTIPEAFIVKLFPISSHLWYQPDEVFRIRLSKPSKQDRDHEDGQGSDEGLEQHVRDGVVVQVKQGEAHHGEPAAWLALSLIVSVL